MTRWQTDDYSPPLSDLPLFASPQVGTMARTSDPETSQAAAAGIVEQLTSLQLRVYVAFVEHGKMTAKEAERLPDFADLGFSTVRKRCSEGVQQEWLRPTGTVRDGCQELEAVQRKPSTQGGIAI
jgi:hypothetical protein